jgi:hypothetical protein
MPWHATALHGLRAEYEVVPLMTQTWMDFHRISHHGMREDLLKRQAEATFPAIFGTRSLSA